jgi:hypothetical protein
MDRFPVGTDETSLTLTSGMASQAGKAVHEAKADGLLVGDWFLEYEGHRAAEESRKQKGDPALLRSRGKPQEWGNPSC